MKRPICLVLAVWTVFFTTKTIAGPVQNPNLVLPPSAADHREAVKDIVVRSYNAYKKFAFGHDDLRPVSGTFGDGRNGWGASIVDALSTLKIMGLDDLFEEAVQFAGGIDFSRSQTPDTVSVFETTIRYLGGLLSAYELGGKQHTALVERARQVADKMAFAWQNQKPFNFGTMDFTTNTPVMGTNSIVGVGTLDLEWSTLTKYTNNETYARLTVNGVRTIASLTPPLPGLPARVVDPVKTTFVGRTIGWGGGSDSYFEYLIKYARLSNTDDNLFADAWDTAVDTSIKVLLRESTVGNHVYLADLDDNSNIIGVSSHLACFHGGNWIYGTYQTRQNYLHRFGLTHCKGGRLLNNDEYVRIGLQLVEGCWNTYASTQTGIGPESFRYRTTNQTDSSNADVLTAAQQAFYDRNGFYITDGRYFLRPEVLESNFYAWRVTGDTKYLDRAASAIDSFNEFLIARQTGGYGGLNNVDDPKAGLIDDEESFWFAEVLKYLYLTFDDPKHISLDEWVFNTEAHPFEAPPAKDVYGSGRKLEYNGPFIFTPATSPLPKISPL